MLLQVWSLKSRADKENDCPQPSGHTSVGADQDTVAFLDCGCSLLSSQPPISLCPGISFSTHFLIHSPDSLIWALDCPQPGVGPLALEVHEVYTSPPLKPVKVLRIRIASFEVVDCTMQLGITYKFVDGVFFLFFQRFFMSS